MGCNLAYVSGTQDTGIYLRISQDRTGDELGVTRQREDARKLAEVRDRPVLREYADNDISASGKRARPGFEALLADIEAGKIRRVIAWDLSRLTRNARDTLRLLESGQRHGVSIALVRGSDMDLSTPAGRLAASILASVAQHEIEVKADRQARAARQAAEQGKRIGGRRPFGYERDGITVRRAEADALIDAYDAVLHGVPLARVAMDWNERGLATPQVRRNGDPSPWTGQTARGVLLNPRYAGLRSLVTAEAAAKGSRAAARLDGIVTDADGLPVRAEWPALVSEETWRAVVETLTEPGRRHAPRSDMALLTGIALCGVCGPDADVTVHGGRQNRVRLGYRTYRCRAAYGHVVRKQEPIDRWIGALVVARLSRPDAADLLLSGDRPDAAALTREAAVLRRRLNTLAAALADEDITRDQHRQQAGRLRARLAEVEAEQADAGRVDILGPLIHAEDVAATWAALDTARQRAVVGILFASIVIMPAATRRGQRASAGPQDVMVTPA